MRFAEPMLLFFLLLLPILAVAWIYAERRRRRDLARWLAPELQERLAAQASRPRRRASAALLAGALLFLVLGAARPQLGSRVLETRQRGIDVVLAVDCSLSMEARDLLPSRRERARQEILALLGKLQGDRIALVSFAGEAFLQCPLTLDRGAIQMLLPLLEPAVMPEPGSDLAAAIHEGIKAYTTDPRRSRALVLLTDGEAHAGDLEAAIGEAKDAKVRICAIGIGKTAGEPIPVPSNHPGQTEFKKDRSGQVVLTRLEEEALKRACQETGGAYVRAESGAAAARIVQALRDLEQGDVQGGLGIRYEERFVYFAAIALLLLLVEGWVGERRRESKA
jgi:Ca-activated chloride channel family protein